MGGFKKRGYTGLLIGTTKDWLVHLPWYCGHIASLQNVPVGWPVHLCSSDWPLDTTWDRILMFHSTKTFKIKLQKSDRFLNFYHGKDPKNGDPICVVWGNKC